MGSRCPWNLSNPICFMPKILWLNQSLKIIAYLFTFHPNYAPEILSSAAPSWGLSLIMFHSFNPSFIHLLGFLFWVPSLYQTLHWALGIERETIATVGSSGSRE